MTAEEDFEAVLDRLEAQGHDMSKMRLWNEAVQELPVGDDTPVPGTLRLVEPLIVFPPPLHEGWSETAEGKFLVPISTPSVPRQVRRLRRHLNHLTYFVAALTMCCLSFAAVVAYRWNG